MEHIIHSLKICSGLGNIMTLLFSLGSGGVVGGSENWAAGMSDMFCSADAPWLDGITPRSISSHDGIRPVFFSHLL